MTMAVIDYQDPTFWADPHPVLRAARERHAVARSTVGDFEILRYAEVESLLKDPRLRQVGLDMLTNQGITSGPLHDWWMLIMFNNDPPVHTRLRSLVGRAFTPRRVEQVRPRIREIAHGLLDGEVGSAESDVVAGFAHELPLVVLCELLGVPAEDHHTIDRWTNALGLAFSPVIPPGTRLVVEDALVRLNDYVDSLVAERRRVPRDDLLTALVDAEEEGDRLDAAELRAMVTNLLFAGHDTTKSLLGIGVHLLATHRDQLERLRHDPALVPAAVEEILRYDSLISGTPRHPVDDIEVAGVPIPAGSYITLSILAANRDPRRFDDPDRFDIARPDNRPLTFGHGIHHCIGSSIARAEAQEAVAVLIERCRELELLEAPRWVPFAASRRFDSLPMRLGAQPRARAST